MTRQHTLCHPYLCQVYARIIPTNFTEEPINFLIQQGYFFSESELPIFYHRFNYFSNRETLTLEQIGHKLDLTRERVRQIVKRINSILYEKLSFLVIFSQYSDYSIDLQEDQDMILVSNDFATNINFRENVHFTQKFYTKVFSFLTPSHRLFLEDKKDETNVYLIRKELFYCFDFGAFYEDVEEKSSKTRAESYSLNFEGYLYGFLQKDDITILERITPICERIVLEDFNLLVDLEGNLTFERTARKTREEYISEALEEVGHPMHVNDIYDYIERKFPAQLPGPDAIRSALQKRPDLFIYCGKASTYGLKKWEDENDSIKGGTIKDIAEEYLQQFDEPKHISEIFSYVNQYRDTSKNNVYNSLRAGYDNRFIFFQGAHIGLKKKNYENLDKFSVLTSNGKKKTKKRRISQKGLITAYYEVYETLGHPPNSTDIDKLGKYGSHNYYNKFGGWKKFLEFIGEDFSDGIISEEDLVNAYYELKESLGRTPSSTEMKKLGKYGTSVYYKRFGGWNKFLESIEETPVKKHNIPDRDLINAYYDLKKRLGHIPKVREMNELGKYSAASYYNRFGGWKKFLRSIGEIPVGKIPAKSSKDPVSKDELIAAYYGLKETLGRIPTTREMDELGKYNYTTYRQHFGGWNQFLESIDETEVRYTTIPEKNLIEAYYELKQKLGHIPTIMEMKKHGKYSYKPYYNTFGGWRKFLALLGELDE